MFQEETACSKRNHAMKEPCSVRGYSMFSYDELTAEKYTFFADSPDYFADLSLFDWRISACDTKFKPNIRIFLKAGAASS